MLYWSCESKKIAHGSTCIRIYFLPMVFFIAFVRRPRCRSSSQINDLTFSSVYTNFFIFYQSNKTLEERERESDSFSLECSLIHIHIYIIIIGLHILFLPPTHYFFFSSLFRLINEHEHLSFIIHLFLFFFLFFLFCSSIDIV